MDLDIAVVGASSAGLLAAERLARAGRSVAVFERQPALRHPRRTYIITPQLRHVLGDVPPSAVLHATPVLELLSPAARAVVTLRDPDLVVERQELALRLAERAEAAGARLMFGHRLTELAPRGPGAELGFALRGGGAASARAAAVVGADGVFSEVAQAAGIARPPVVQIVQAEIELPAGHDPAVTQIWFDPELTRYFFWLLPETEGRAVLGVIADTGVPTRDLLDAFLARRGLRALAYQASTVAMHHPSLRPWGAVGRAPVYLAGDAAGQVKVTTVGGTVTGFYGAEAAARCILEGASPRAAYAAVTRELDVHWWVRWVLERLDGRGYDELLRGLSPAVLDFLARRNRDEMAGAIWKVPFLSPALVATGARALLRPGAEWPVLRPGAPEGRAASPERSSAD